MYKNRKGEKGERIGEQARESQRQSDNMRCEGKEGCLEPVSSTCRSRNIFPSLSVERDYRRNSPKARVTSAKETKAWWSVWNHWTAKMHPLSLFLLTSLSLSFSPLSLSLSFLYHSLCHSHTYTPCRRRAHGKSWAGTRYSLQCSLHPWGHTARRLNSAATGPLSFPPGSYRNCQPSLRHHMYPVDMPNTRLHGASLVNTAPGCMIRAVWACRLR